MERPVGAADERGQEPSVDQERLREQLRKIVGSQVFEGAARDRKFLSYIVEETLAGRAERIKAYAIAVEVFNRDASFDPQSDPIVRVQAGHLRRALEQYYNGPGRDDPFVITVPRGGYVPRFEERSRPSEREAPMAPVAEPPPVRVRAFPWAASAVVAIIAAALLTAATATLRARLPSPAAGPAIPRLSLQPLEARNASESSNAIAAGLTREIASRLARFKDLVVIVAQPPAPGHEPPVADAAERFTLDGAIDLSDSKLRLQVRVLDRAQNSVLWGKTYLSDLDVTKLLDIESTLAGEVVTAVGQPYGVVFQADASRVVPDAPEDWEAYACTLKYYAYRASLNASLYPATRKCLEQAVKRYPSYATAWALLSQIYIDEFRFRYPPVAGEPPASLDRAQEAARRAVEIDPQNARAQQAQMFALYLSGNVEAALRVGASALEANQDDTELMGEYGYRLALSGNWEQGCALVSRAYERNPGPRAYYETALALCSYIRDDYASAAMWIRKAAVVDNPMYHLIAAAVLAEAGPAQAATAESQWLKDHAPSLLKDIRSVLATRAARKQDIDRFVASLRKAGLTITE